MHLLLGFTPCLKSLDCLCCSRDSVSLAASTMNVQNQQSQRQAARGDGDGTTGEGEPIAAQAWNVGPGEQHPLLPEGIWERVLPPHQALVNGIFSLYEVLISMRYISRSDIYWPPYPTSLFNSQQWLSEGFEQEVVDLLALLAYPKVGSNLGP